MTNIKVMTVKEAIQDLSDKLYNLESEHHGLDIKTETDAQHMWSRIDKLEKQMKKFNKLLMQLNEQFTSICG